MSDKNDCPICGQGQVSLHHFASTLDYRGQSEQVQTAIKRCDHCESEFADAEVSRNNKRTTVAFHKRVDGLLSGAQIQAGRKRLGLNQKQAAQLFGGGPVAFSKYENDDVAQSAAMDRLLRLTFGDDHVFQRLLEQSGLHIKLATPTRTPAAH